MITAIGSAVARLGLVLGALFFGVSAVANAQVNTADLLDGIDLDGFTVDPSLPTHELTWSEVSALTNTTIPGGATDQELLAFRAGIRSWSDDGGNVLVVSAYGMGDVSSASNMMNGAIESSQSRWSEVEAPFEHATAFADVPGGMTFVVWRQGPFLISVAYITAFGLPDVQLTNSLADQVEQAVRSEIGESPAGASLPDNRISYRIGRALGVPLFVLLVTGVVLLIRRQRAYRRSHVHRADPSRSWPAPSSPRALPAPDPGSRPLGQSTD